MKYKITADYNGARIERIATDNSQAFTIINDLIQEGCTDICMREREPVNSGK